MDFEPKSIDEQIECLARLTGASASFVTQVKELFTRKGIPLESAATPYVKALEEAFRREESIRTTSWRARQSISKLNRHFSKLGEAYVKRVSGTGAGAGAPAKRAPARTVTVYADHRALITGLQREVPPTVPGPDELQ
jgi:hypothetical protein